MFFLLEALDLFVKERRYGGHSQWDAWCGEEAGVSFLWNFKPLVGHDDRGVLLEGQLQLVLLTNEDQALGVRKFWRKNVKDFGSERTLYISENVARNFMDFRCTNHKHLFGDALHKRILLFF